MSEIENETNHYFIDTNIWLYAFIEANNNEKMVKAKTIIESTANIIINTQVINETCINLSKKAQFTERQIQRLIDSFYTNYIVVETTEGSLLKASELREIHSFSFWDSLIISSALASDASILLSEDMQNGMIVEQQLEIINPFDRA